MLPAALASAAVALAAAAVAQPAAALTVAATAVAPAAAALALAAAALWIRRRGAGLVQALPAPEPESGESSRRGRPDRHQPAVRAAQR